MRLGTNGDADHPGDARGPATGPGAHDEPGSYRGRRRVVGMLGRRGVVSAVLVMAGAIAVAIVLVVVSAGTPVTPVAAPVPPSLDGPDSAVAASSPAVDILSPSPVPVATRASTSGRPPAPAAAASRRSGASPTASLVWSDEFSGAAGSGPDGGKWVRDTGGSGYGNNELEFYTSGTGNAALDGSGHLVITARQENPAGYACWYGGCQYTSARLNTSGRFSVRYGRVEARIKLPRGQGMWPAFWALGDNFGSVGWPACGEIDIMENVGREPGRNHGSLHGPGYSGGNPLTGTYSLPGGQAFADGFHVFAVDWSPNLVRFFVDGALYESRTPADTNGAPWAFNHSFFLVLDLAVGGSFPGSPDAGTAFPQQMVVDYVRVYA
jgi:beta-glucanase (GH16 family)